MIWPCGASWTRVNFRSCWNRNCGLAGHAVLSRVQHHGHDRGLFPFHLHVPASPGRHRNRRPPILMQGLVHLGLFHLYSA